MGIKKDIDLLSGFTGSYSHVDRIEWDKFGNTKIHVATYKDKATAALGIAAERTVIQADSAKPPTQAEAYAIVMAEQKFLGGAEE